MRVAIIDIGSNSIKLLVAEGADARPIFEAHSETRLSPNTESARERIPDAAFAAGISAVRELAALAREHAPETLAIVGTSLFRTAENARDFAEAVRRATGTPMRILSGTEEAELVAAGVATEPAAGTPCAIFDLGGGSLEFIVKISPRAPALAESRPLGAVRLTRKFFKNPAAPISENELNALRNFLRAEFVPAISAKIPAGARVVLCGGAVGICAHFVREEISEKTPTETPAGERPSATEIPAAFFGELLEKIAAGTLAERVALGVPEKRADILPAALVALSEICRAAGARSVLYTRRNLRYGFCARENSHS